MEENQKINCTVESCVYQDSENKRFLAAIVGMGAVAVAADSPFAFFEE